MKLSATVLVFNILLVATNGASSNLRFRGVADDDKRQRGLQDESILTIDSGSNYTEGGNLEIILELVAGPVRRRNLMQEGDVSQHDQAMTLARALQECEESTDPADCKEEVTLEDPNDTRALEAVESVKGMALGLEGLKAMCKAVKRKITKDENLFPGVVVNNTTVTVQKILDPDAEAASSRRLQYYRNFVALYMRSIWNCDYQYCGWDNSDGRRKLQADPAVLKAGCKKLARKVLNAAGRREVLLSNIQSIQLKIDVPGVEEPVTCRHQNSYP